ncbi:MAG: C40 family peptidase [Armatimonadetes bacterium]|nr:C40 family peptidase [Armatimonadota bacterium]
MSDQERLVQTALGAVKGEIGGFVTERGMCGRFVREVHQRVDPKLWMDKLSRPYNRDSDRDGDTDARDLEYNMIAAGKRAAFSDMQPGDAVFFNRGGNEGGSHGHVALSVGEGRIAENSTRATGIIASGPGALKLSRLPPARRISSICRLWVPTGPLPDDGLPLFEETSPPVRWCHDQGFILGDGKGHFLEQDLNGLAFNTVTGRVGMPPIEGDPSLVVTRQAVQGWRDRHFASRSIHIDLAHPQQVLKLTSLCYILFWLKGKTV